MTGGFVSAVLAAVAITGHAIDHRVGIAFVIGMVIVAQYRAWRDERERAEAANRELEAIRTPGIRLTVTSIAEMQSVSNMFTVGVNLFKRGAGRTNIRDDWILQVLDSPTTPAMHGSMVGKIRPMDDQDDFDVDLSFWYGPAIPDATALRRARFELTVHDGFGNLLRAEYPSS